MWFGEIVTLFHQIEVGTELMLLCVLLELKSMAWSSLCLKFLIFSPYLAYTQHALTHEKKELWCQIVLLTEKRGFCVSLLFSRSINLIDFLFMSRRWSPRFYIGRDYFSCTVKRKYVCYLWYPTTTTMQCPCVSSTPFFVYFIYNFSVSECSARRKATIISQNFFELMYFCPTILHLPFLIFWRCFYSRVFIEH